jgi:hypothetical protein
MKGFRKAIIVGALAVVAGFLYWFFEVKKEKEKEEAGRQEALLFEQTEKRVARISLKKQGEKEIVLQWERREPAEGEEEVGDDEEGDWIVVEPVETGGDDPTIDTMVKSMLQASSEEVIWESLEKQAEFGLDDPVLSLRFFYEGEDIPHGIDLGKKTLDNKKVFARVVGEERIYAVPTSVLDTVNKSLYDLRDKKLAPYEKEDIVGITALTGREMVLLEREGEEWYLQPNHVKASTTRVDIYTGNLRWESFVEVVEDKVENVERYGFDTPRLIITLKLEDDSAFLFVVGDMVQEGDAQFFYATRSSDNLVFKLKGETVQKLIPDGFNLRDRSIFDFDREQVSRVIFSRDEQSYTFEKQSDDEWKLAAVENVDGGEESIGQTLERGYKIDNVVRGVATAEYEDIEPIHRGDALYERTGIDSPRYEVVLEFKDGREPVRVELTEREEETGKTFLTPDGGDTVYHTSGYFLTNFPESVQELFE